MCLLGEMRDFETIHFRFPWLKRASLVGTSQTSSAEKQSTELDVFRRSTVPDPCDVVGSLLAVLANSFCIRRWERRVRFVENSSSSGARNSIREGKNTANHIIIHWKRHGINPRQCFDELVQKKVIGARKLSRAMQELQEFWNRAGWKQHDRQSERIWQFSKGFMLIKDETEPSLMLAAVQ